MAAVRAAHLRQTFQDKSLIFVSVAESSLNNLIYEACKRLVNTFSSRNPSSFILSKWFTEIYFISHFFIQMSYLKRFSATFSEHLYGLRRTSIKNKENLGLSKKEILVSLLFTTIFPYAKEKLAQVINDSNFERQVNKSLYKKSLIKLNVWANLISNVASTAQYIIYLCGKTDIVTPSLWASGVKLNYDNEPKVEKEMTLREFWPQALQKGLELGAFFLQFSHWWQTERIESSRKLSVPPPIVERVGNVNICPLCNSNPRDKTVLATSGYVFCYNCISSFVEKYKKCPMTNISTNLHSLIKLQE